MSDQVRLSDPIPLPWSDRVVEALNHWQQSGVVHEYTCPDCLWHSMLGTHQEPAYSVLRATRNGWICQTCPYTHTEAQQHMVYRNPLGQIIIPHPRIRRMVAVAANQVAADG